MYLAEIAPAPAQSWWQAGLTKLSEALPTLATSYSQVRLMEENLKRAKAGLPPIDAASIAPTVRVQAEVDPQLKRTIILGIGAAVAIGLLFALRR